MVRNYRMFIAGEWVDSLAATTFDDLNPYTGEVFARVAGGGAADVTRAVDAAAAALPAWAATAPSERRAVLLRAAREMEERRQDIALILAEEAGTAGWWGNAQIDAALGCFQECASQVHRVTGRVIPADLPGQFSMTLRRPAGVVAGIAPWNNPLILSLQSVAYAIAYGNTTVLKPSAETPASGGAVIAEVFEAADLPPGVLNLVINAPGKSGEVGEVLISDPRVRRISFTGSTEVGRKLAELAGKHLKHMTLELGGTDALIILADADIDYAVDAATFGRFLHQGQVCMNSKRLIVEAPIAEEFTRRFVSKVRTLKMGDPREPGVCIGPLINKSQVEILAGQVEEAIGEGAVLACGGGYSGCCYEPTVLIGVTREMAVSRTELFGPVAQVIVAKDAEDALEITNSSPYGLSGGVITRDLQKGLELAEGMESGAVHVNDQSFYHEHQAPFGGVKDSGYGKHGGLETIDEFTEVKWVTYQKTPRRFPF